MSFVQQHKKSSGNTVGACCFTQWLAWQVIRFTQLPPYAIYDYTFAHLLVHSIVHSIIHSTLCMLYYSSHLCAENQSLLHLFCRSSSRSHVFHFQKALSLICMLTVIFRITTWLVRATPFVDKVVKNAEDSPLECWECDSWIPQTSRQPQQRDCFEQWIQTRWPIHDKEELPTQVLYLYMAVGQRYCRFNLIGLEKSCSGMLYFTAVYFEVTVSGSGQLRVCVCMCGPEF